MSSNGVEHQECKKSTESIVQNGATLSVQETFWDVLINGISQDIIDGLDLILGQLISKLVNINLSLYENESSNKATDTS